MLSLCWTYEDHTQQRHVHLNSKFFKFQLLDLDLFLWDFFHSLVFKFLLLHTTEF